ncbi:MAG: hypothetical protein JWR22_1293 [Herminiimonas sp.]|nr:hypothetical protein [Herminiimonas sp.]
MTKSSAPKPQLDAKRRRLLSDAVCTLCDAIESLESVVPNFPGNCGLSKGDVDPELAIHGFARLVDPITTLLMALLNGESVDEIEGLPPGLIRSRSDGSGTGTEVADA